MKNKNLVANLWISLIINKQFDLITKLHRAEKHELGFCSIVVKKEGFSEDDSIHNLVLKFLQINKINIVNPNLEKTKNSILIREFKCRKKKFANTDS